MSTIEGRCVVFPLDGLRDLGHDSDGGMFWWNGTVSPWCSYPDLDVQVPFLCRRGQGESCPVDTFIHVPLVDDHEETVWTVEAFDVRSQLSSALPPSRL